MADFAQQNRHEALHSSLRYELVLLRNAIVFVVFHKKTGILRSPKKPLVGSPNDYDYKIMKQSIYQTPQNIIGRVWKILHRFIRYIQN